MYTSMEIKAFKKLIDTQKKIVANTDYDKNDKILEKLNELEELLPNDRYNEKDEYPQEIHFNGINFNLIQYARKGKYILWSINNGDVDCGIGFNTNKEVNDYTIYDEMFFSRATKRKGFRRQP